MKNSIIANLFLTTRWYVLMGVAVLLFFSSFFVNPLFEGAVIYTCSLLLVTIADLALLFSAKSRLDVNRIVTNRFSLGDENNVTLSLFSTFPFRITLKMIDELPPQFQDRDFYKTTILHHKERAAITYSLRPVTRGAYLFGNLLCYIQSPLHLLERRIVKAQPQEVKVYPSYQQLKKHQLMATSTNLFAGVKKIRRLGHSMEFEKIKNYVHGDDMRSINWKATARSSGLMVNIYTDTRQQQVYCMIDKGRAMKMPFDGMTLLDYSINASLALLNISLLRHDRAGLITFSNTINDAVPAERKNNQLNTLLETLYKQETDFKESDYENIWSYIHRRVTQRSFMLLFTNFETHSSLERQLPFLKKMADRHLVCVVFFENTLLKELHETQPDDTEGIYIKTIAQHFTYEKKQIVKELRKHGILSILTNPTNLTVDVINKYLELKARHMI